MGSGRHSHPRYSRTLKGVCRAHGLGVEEDLSTEHCIQILSLEVQAPILRVGCWLSQVVEEWQRFFTLLSESQVRSVCDTNLRKSLTTGTRTTRMC